MDRDGVVHGDAQLFFDAKFWGLRFVFGARSYGGG